MRSKTGAGKNSQLFLDKQSSQSRKRYTALLRAVGSISKLFSDSSVPYLYYRIHENIFCKAFAANNHSRSDLSVDAVKDNVGVGLKTYLEHSGASYQKIAEFNSARSAYVNQHPENKIRIVSQLRNERLEFAKNSYGLHSMIYHCVVRCKGEMRIFEASMPSIHVEKIRLGKVSDASIHFTDGIEEYSFNLSKSTLLKKFRTSPKAFSIKVPILDDPFSALEIEEEGYELPELFDRNADDKISIVLPLYSDRSGSVEAQSGLNQWRAKGRKRDQDEVYIPIPSWIHKVFKGFFPPRKTEFILQLPNGRDLRAAICQSGGKALMSNPNAALGYWLLRQGLQLAPRQLATDKHLKRIGIDAVEITKVRKGLYSIDFRPVGSYEDFKTQYKTKIN